MSREDANVLFEKLTILADGDRARLWGTIKELKREHNKTPTLGEVVIRLTRPESSVSPPPSTVTLGE